MPLFYYDEQGYKVGPIDKRTLFALAENGKISPETRLTDGNREMTAKNVPGLKFYAPEYYMAEKIFDPKNYNLDTGNLPGTEPVKKQEITTEPKLNIIAKWFLPNIRKEHNITRKNGYFYLTNYQRILYFLTYAIWYCGFTITIIVTIMSSRYPIMMVPIFIVGTILTIFFSASFGFTADCIQWFFNIENHLEQIKNRFNSDN